MLLFRTLSGAGLAGQHANSRRHLRCMNVTMSNYYFFTSVKQISLNMST